MKYKYLIIMLIALLLAGCSSESNEKPLYTGTIEADTVSLSTELSGKIINTFVEDGQKVAKGDKVIEIDTTDLEIKLKKAKAALKSSEANLEDILQGARGEEIKNARAQMKNIETQLEGAKKNYEYRLQNYNDMNELYENSAASEQQIKDAKSLLDIEETKVKGLEKQLEASRASLDLLLSGATKNKIKMAEAEVEISRAEIEALENEISKGNITAPIDGTIEAVNYETGEFVPAGGNIVKIVDLEDLWVKIYVPEKELHKVSINQNVNLWTDHSNNKVVRGKVVYIASEAEFTPKNVESKENKEEMVFEVKIKILDRNSSLKPGMLLDADLEGDI